MTDTYFDELGTAWRANIPDIDALTIRLSARLRRQTLINRAVVTLEMALTVLGITIGASLVWTGIFGQGSWRNTAGGLLIIVVTVIAVALSVSVLRGENGDSKSLSSMIDLAISRAERSFRRLRMMYFSCAALAVYIAAMWIVHPAIDKLPPDVVHHRLLSATKFGIIWTAGWTIWAIYRRGRAQQELAKLRHLKVILTAD